MVRYSEDGKTATVDGIRFTRDEGTGYYLAARPTHRGHRERLHVYVYRTRCGEVPEGHHVHHRDGDKRNNEPSNLALLSGSEHASWHGHHMSAERLEEVRRILAENARPKASEWHGSPEGLAWHSEHGKEVAAARMPERHVCDQCGAVFWYKGRKTGHHFCSNKCKSAFRRASGVDDESRLCERCGREFRANRYSRQRYCCRGCARAARGDGGRVQHDG